MKYSNKERDFGTKKTVMLKDIHDLIHFGWLVAALLLFKYVTHSVFLAWLKLHLYTEGGLWITNIANGLWRDLLMNRIG